jgi:hypothetical protein
VQNISRAKRRCGLTHIGLICDRPDLQPVLPQVIVGNERTFKAKDLAALTAARPPNVHLVRQKSAWNNVGLMRRVVRLLAEALQPHMHEVQPILLFDACRVHLATEVIAACTSLQIWPIVVPAKITWLLQPLDTHAFQLYKARLKEFYQSARISSGAGDLDMSQFLRCVYQTIRQVLQGRAWSGAFDKDGFGHQQDGVSPYVMRTLEYTEPVRIPGGMPTEEQLRLCFPARAVVPTAALLKPCLPQRRVLSTPFGARGSTKPAVPKPVAVAEPRTRLQHRRAEEARAKVAAKAAPKAYTGPLLGVTRFQHRRAVAALGASASAPSSSSKGP